MSHEEIKPITEEKLAKLVSSPEFLSKVAASKGICGYEKAFSLFHQMYGDEYFVSRIVDGEKGCVETYSQLQEDCKARFGSNFYELISFHYHEDTLQPSLFGEQIMYELAFEYGVGKISGDLNALRSIRITIAIHQGVDIMPIMAIGRSTNEDDVTILLVQERGIILPPPMFREGISGLFKDLTSSHGDEESVVKILEESGLYKARTITINTASGISPSDLEKIAYFAFEPKTFSFF